MQEWISASSYRKEMEGISRSAAVVVVGILIVGGVFRMTNRPRDGKAVDPVKSGATPESGLSGASAPPRVNSDEDPEEEAIRGRTKSTERPGPGEMAKARLERELKDSRWQLESARESGLGHAHPVVRNLSARIEAIEADLEAVR